MTLLIFHIELLKLDFEKDFIYLFIYLLFI